MTDAERLRLAGASWRGIAELLGRSHEYWRYTVLNALIVEQYGVEL